MTKRKTLEELTIKDNFMFGAVMCDEDLCRNLLELILGFEIERVEVSKEKSMVYHPEYKGIRLDVYAKDENNTHYNVEMQAVTHAALGKRARYYHSQIDMDLLRTGKEYMDLPRTYVIFICDFDPFGKRKYRYTFRSVCLEEPDIGLEDESETIFLSTKGCNREDVSPELATFLEYVGAELHDSTNDYEDDFVGRLQNAVTKIKKSRRMEERYMLTELLMQDERRAGRAEGRAEGRTEESRESILGFLSEISNVPDNLHERIMQEDRLEQLRKWVKLAARVESIDQFIKEM